ncbi:MAG: Ig domain-containing protein [Anaerocolumna sp.]
MKTFIKKCCFTLGLLLFFTIILPFPNVGNTKVAAASVVETEQTDIKLNVKSKSIIKDDTFTLKVYNVTSNQKISFKSSSTTIATVDDSGVITAVDFGTATISVTVKEGFKTITTQECQITVGPPAISVKLTKSEITLEVGERATLMAILKPNNTVEEAKFVSNDYSIASVSLGGQVTARTVGVTYIFASISNGKYDVCKVTVVEKSNSDSSTTK